MTKIRRPRLTAEQIARARALLTDGCSQSEVARTIGCAQSRISTLFPGTGWTSRQGGEFGQLVRRVNRKETL